MSVVLEEVRHQNQSAYQRLRTLTAAADRRFFVFSNEHHRYMHLRTPTYVLHLCPADCILP